MLWYKTWLETRSRFLIGLALVVLTSAGAVFAYPKVMQLMPLVPTVDVGGELGRRIREGAELMRDYRGYVWSQWIRQSLSNLETLFAVLLGTGGLLPHSSRGAALFMMSMPVSRTRLLATRAATGLAELLAMAIVPLLLVPLLSPSVGQRYAIGDAAVHGACLFVAGAVFLSLAILLSTMFNDVWRPLLLACGVAIAIGLAETAFLDGSAYGIFSLMDGEGYFRTGRLPWQGLLAGVAISAALLHGAVLNFARQDF
jgi:ABC-type transport system involved in multi-copper enzyme maturation permease subunit